MIKEMIQIYLYIKLIKIFYIKNYNGQYRCTNNKTLTKKYKFTNIVTGL